MKSRILKILRWALCGLWIPLALVGMALLSETITPRLTANIAAAGFSESAFWIVNAIQSMMTAALLTVGPYVIAPSNKFKAACTGFIIGTLLGTYITFVIVPAEAAPNLLLRYTPYTLAIVTGFALLYYLQNKDRDTE